MVARRRNGAGALTVCVVAMLWSCGSALATVTRAQITAVSPTSAYPLDDQMAIPDHWNEGNPLTISGTSDGTTGDKIAVGCYSAAASTPLAGDVPVNADGSFTITTDLFYIAGGTCTIKAVPDTGGDVDPPPDPENGRFNGPTVAVSQREPDWSGNGHLNSFFINGAQMQGGFNFSSVGWCGIGGYIIGPELSRWDVEGCSATFRVTNGGINYANSTGAPATRSELQVDGEDAYLPGNIPQLNAVNGDWLPGVPAESYQFSHDPSSGDTAVDETEQVVTCSPGGVFPATTDSCTSFAPTGITVRVHYSQTDDGRVAAVTQTFSSTDGRDHTIDLLESNSLNAANYNGQYAFPWLDDGAVNYSSYDTPDQRLAGPADNGPGSFFEQIENDSPALSKIPQAAVTFSSAPSQVRIVVPSNDPGGYSSIELHYVRDVPADGSVSLGFDYSNGFTLAEVQAEASAAEAAFAQGGGTDPAPTPPPPPTSTQPPRRTLSRRRALSRPRAPSRRRPPSRRHPRRRRARPVHPSRHRRHRPRWARHRTTRPRP